MRVSPMLEIAETDTGKAIVCSDCGARLGPAGEPWKPHAVLREWPIRDQSTGDTGDDRVVRREFGCPGCGALLDTETALDGDPFLDDVLFV